MSLEIQPQRFKFWLSHTLTGFIVLFQLGYSLPMFVTFTYLDYSDGTLTLGRTARIALIASISGIVVALIMWFTLFRWLVYLRRDTEAMRAG
jgi:hypothetical protein